jgi:hypothetical protein
MVTSSPQPAPKHGVHQASNAVAGFMPVHATREKAIVFGFRVTDMGSHSEIDRGVVEALGCGGSPNPVTVLATSVFGDGALSLRGAPRIESSHFLGESLHVLAVSRQCFLRTSLRPSCAGRRVFEAGGLGGFEGLPLDE